LATRLSVKIKTNRDCWPHVAVAKNDHSKVCLLSFWLHVVFINTNWGFEYRDSHKINRIDINDRSYTTDETNYKTKDVVYITLGV